MDLAPYSSLDLTTPGLTDSVTPPSLPPSFPFLTVKFRTACGTQKMQNTFLLAAILTTSGIEREVSCLIDCVQMYCHRKGPSHSLYPVSHNRV